MEILQAVILGIVQGIGEFRPISSSGHLVIAGELLDKVFQTTTSDSDKLLLNVTLHAGTLFAILIVYRDAIWKLRIQLGVCMLLVIASIPAGVAGIAFREFFETVFATPLVAGVALFATAGLLFAGRTHRARFASSFVSRFRNEMFRKIPCRLVTPAHLGGARWLLCV